MRWFLFTELKYELGDGRGKCIGLFYCNVPTIHGTKKLKCTTRRFFVRYRTLNDTVLLYFL